MVRVLAAVVVLLVLIGGGWALVGSGSSGSGAPDRAPDSLGSGSEAADPGAETSELEDSPPRSSSADRTAVESGDQGATDSPAVTFEWVVQGRVVDLRGMGVADAEVKLLDPRLESSGPAAMLGLGELARAAGLAKRRVETDADGRFVLELDGEGAFRLLVEHAEHPREEYRGEAENETTVGVVITLRDGAEIRGRVEGVPDEVTTLSVVARRINPLDVASKALMDISSLVDNVGGGTLIGDLAEVAPDRSFRIAGLDPDDRFHVWAVRTDEGEQPTKCTERVDVRAGAVGVELRWREPLTIGLRVLDDATGQPLERLAVAAGFVRKVKMMGMSVPIATKQRLPRTEFPEGEVLIDQLEVQDGDRETVAIDVGAHGYRTLSRDDIEVPRAGHVDLGEVRLRTAPIVRVSVVAAATGEPVPGASVELDPEGESEPAPGERGSRSISFSTNFSATVDSDDDPRAAGIEVDTGQAGNSARGVTDSDGVCELTAQFDGAAVVRVTSDEFAPFVSDSFVVAMTGTTERHVSLSAGGTVRLTVVDSHGVVKAGAAVQRTGPFEDDHEALRVGGDGVHVFERLAVGEHAFRLSAGSVDESGLNVDVSGLDDEEPGSRVAVMVAEGVTTEARLVEPVRCNLRGVVLIDGEPLDGASVRCVAAESENGDFNAAAMSVVEGMLGGLIGLEDARNGSTDVDGRFALEGIPIGARRIFVSHRDLSMPAVRVVTLVEGDNVHDVVLQDTVVRGVVVDADGKPLRGARVTVQGAAIAAADSASLEGAEEAFATLFGSDSGRGVKTGSDGAFELRGVRADTPLVVRVTARRHVAGEARVRALPAGTDESGVRVALASAGRVRVSARGVDGAMTVRAVWVAPPGDTTEHPDVQRMLRNGRATLDGLVPGRWRVRLGGMPNVEEEVEPREIDLVAGETARVDFAN